ncbi:MAG: YceI family protein [Gammaproteobacteria bacterium]
MHNRSNLGLWIPTVFLIGAGILSPHPSDAAVYRLNPPHTYPQFEIRHLVFSLIHGQFNHTRGYLSLNRAKGRASVFAKIWVRSLDTGYPPRDRDLMAPAFFDAARYPYLYFHSTGVRFEGRHRAMLKGNLTMRGVTHPVVLQVTRIHCAISPLNQKRVCGFDAQGSLERSWFGIDGFLPVLPDHVRLILNADAVIVKHPSPAVLKALH